MKSKYLYPVLFIVCTSICSNKSEGQEYKGFRLLQTDTVTIKNKLFVLDIYKNESAVSFFVVKKKTGGNFKVIMKDLSYGTNNSDLFFNDQNNDGFLDIVWTKKWQNHAYLFDPKTENFVEVGEFHTIDTLKIGNDPILYKKMYPLLYYWNYEKPLEMGGCGDNDDTMFVENHSELFIIDSNYQKTSFATLDNFSTIDKDNFRDTIGCGVQIIQCYVPPYFGKYGPNNIWNSGYSVDSFRLESNNSFFGQYGEYAIDSTFISNYWLKNYSKLLKYGQIFKVRRDEPLEYYK